MALPHTPLRQLRPRRCISLLFFLSTSFLESLLATIQSRLFLTTSIVFYTTFFPYVDITLNVQIALTRDEIPRILNILIQPNGITTVFLPFLNNDMLFILLLVNWCQWEFPESQGRAKSTKPEQPIRPRCLVHRDYLQNYPKFLPTKNIHKV